MRRDGYVAFLSYSHRDKSLANWLHRALETYALPARLVGRDSPIGPIPKRLRPIFRDREELAASEDLGERIEGALRQARALIVLCSPAAARSRWTNEEIATFKRVNPGAPILAAIVAGEPYMSEMPGREEQECFPPALRYQLDGEGRLTDRRAEPIAADFRPEGDGKRLAKLKIVAGLFGLGLDELVQRDNARRNRRLGLVAASLAVGMVGTSGLALYAFDQQQEAVEQREQANGLVEFMLTDLKAKLEPVGRLDALDSVGDRALAYYAQQDLASLDADALGRRARALLLVSEVAELRGDPAEALRGFREAARTTGELLEREPDDWQRIFDHAQSIFWVGYMEGVNGNEAGQLAAFLTYQQLGDALVRLRPEDRQSLMEAGFGGINLGLAWRESGEPEKALASLEDAERRLEAIDAPDRDIRMAIAETSAHRASILHFLGEDQASAQARQSQIEQLMAIDATGGDAEIMTALAYASESMAKARFASGALAEADRSYAECRRLWTQLRGLDATNVEWQKGQAQCLASSALHSHVRDRTGEARAQLVQARGLIEQLGADEASREETLLERLKVEATALLVGASDGPAGLAELARDLDHEELARGSQQNREILGLAYFALGKAVAPSNEARARSYWQRTRSLMGQSDDLSTGGRALLAAAERRLGTAEGETVKLSANVRNFSNVYQ
ncbi:TIR domain-containing protein [Sphingomicrobium aestuariivivum]|uniref:TIR domain-containing protein n=1 Tax=Sphingomicrobium aestuariivivum TaxID=1582356 RepID=UPI001FD67F51|nr:TIR domain-containing protein [Sphingomicrobium aestuariivivum]MCJ8191912.1 toll/interleukin-1 receptor domain-containing protein [Sphingomicrobium aestuariivivum]